MSNEASQVNLVRASILCPTVEDVTVALNASGHDFLHAMGVLAWHDKHWKVEPNQLPPAFLEKWEHKPFSRPRAKLLLEAIIFGPEAQARIVRVPEGFRVVIEAEGWCPEAAPWKDADLLSESCEAMTGKVMALQNSNVFQYAEKRGAFKGSYSDLSAKSGIPLVEYRQNGVTIAWRLAPGGHA